MSDTWMELRRLALAATPGPWELERRVIHGKDYGVYGVILTPDEPNEEEDGERLLRMSGSGGAISYSRYVVRPSDVDADDENLTYIAAANPAQVLALLDALDRLTSDNKRMREALKEIAELEPRQAEHKPDDWDAQVKACEECQRYAGHPIQRGICNTHRQPLWANQRHRDDENFALGHRAKSVARAALTSKEGEDE